MDPMNYGPAGTLVDHANAEIESRSVDATPPEQYGDACSLTMDGKITKVSADNTVMIYGVIVGAYPRVNQNPVAGKTDNAGIKVRVLVPVGAGESYPGCPAFVRVQTPDGANKRVGGWEATADDANTVQVKNAVFDSVADANGMAILKFGFTAAQ